MRLAPGLSGVEVKLLLLALCQLCLLGVLSLVVCAASEGAARAEGFCWQADAAVRRALLGPLSRGVLTVEVRTQTGANDFDYETLIEVAWRGAASGATSRQVLFEGFGAAHASEFEVRLEEDTLVLRYPVADRYALDAPMAEERWRWQASSRRFVERSIQPPSPSLEALEALRALLAEGRLRAARDLLEGLDQSTRGGLALRDDELFVLFLEATHRLALTSHRAGHGQEAAALVLELLEAPPVMAASLRPQPGQLVLCRAGDPRCEGGFIDLPAEPSIGLMINDCAYVLERAGHDALAADLLEQVVAAFPERAVAHLNLADALQDQGEHARSHLHYARYVTLRRSARAVPLRLRLRGALQQPARAERAPSGAAPVERDPAPSAPAPVASRLRDALRAPLLRAWANERAAVSAPPAHPEPGGAGASP